MEPKPFKSVDDQISILRERGMKYMILSLLALSFVKSDTIDCLDIPIPIVLSKQRQRFSPITLSKEPRSKKWSSCTGMIKS